MNKLVNKLRYLLFADVYGRLIALEQKCELLTADVAVAKAESFMHFNGISSTFEKVASRLETLENKANNVIALPKKKR